MYGPLIIAYLFLGGAAAGALTVVSAWSLALRRSRARNQLAARALAVGASPERIVAAFVALRARVYVVGLAMLAFAMLCLLWDLGSPARALLVFLRPHPTTLTFGAYTLAFELALATLLTIARLTGFPRLRERTFAVLEALCCAGGVATMAYTGVFLMGGAVAFWNTWALVGLFTLSSLSAGLSAVLLIDWLTQGRTPLLRAAKPLQRFHLACLAVEAVFLALFTVAACTNPDASGALALLAAPDMLPTAAIGVVGFGIIAPAALEIYSLTRTDCRTIPAADVTCLTGCLILRAVVIACGVH